MPHSSSRCLWCDACFWLVAHALLWGLFAGGQGWALGLPSVLLATAVSHWLGLQPPRMRLAALPGFLGFFLLRMVAGAWDVARRAVHPRRPLAPAWVDYRLRHPAVGMLLSALVGLLPGTLSSQVDDGLMRLHVLDERQPWEPTVALLERHLARLLYAEGAPA